ncbi:MAG: hypothetical protein Q4G30_10570 [Actinomycetaceae bacterium]|nr:hypothetical protein [Actinomycetaceae bacterium]
MSSSKAPARVWVPANPLTAVCADTPEAKHAGNLFIATLSNQGFTCTLTALTPQTDPCAPLRVALLSGESDIALHLLDDLATFDMPGLSLIAVSKDFALEIREDEDALGNVLAELDDLDRRLELQAERAFFSAIDASRDNSLKAEGVLTRNVAAVPAVASGTLTLSVSGVWAGHPVDLSADTVLPLGKERTEFDYAIACSQELGIALADEVLSQF